MAYSREQNTPLIFSENIFKNGRWIATKQTGYGPPVFVHAVKNAIKPEDVVMR
jgi:hypothetical protein